MWIMDAERAIAGPVLLEGEVEMDSDAGLSAKEKADKFTLSCVAKWIVKSKNR